MRSLLLPRSMVMTRRRRRYLVAQRGAVNDVTVAGQLPQLRM